MMTNGPSERITASTATSRSLLVGLKQSDADAWDRLVGLYSPLIYYWCRRMNLPEQEMPDVFQEVFQSVARTIKKFRRERSGGTFRGWLRTVTRNKVLDYYRKAGREPRPTGGTEAKHRFEQIPSIEIERDTAKESGTEDGSIEPNSTGKDGTEQVIFRELYDRALASIRPHFQEKTWQAFWRVVVEGRSTSDVASELSMQPGAVRVAKSRVLHRLRQELGESKD